MNKRLLRPACSDFQICFFPGRAKAKWFRLPICFFPGQEKAKWFRLPICFIPGQGKSKMAQTSNLQNFFPGLPICFFSGREKANWFRLPICFFPWSRLPICFFPGREKAKCIGLPIWKATCLTDFQLLSPAWKQTISAGEAQAHNLLLMNPAPYALGHSSLEKCFRLTKGETGCPGCSPNLLFPAQASNLLFPGPAKSKMAQTSNLLFPRKRLRLPTKRFRHPICFFPGLGKAKGADIQFAFSRAMVQTSNLLFFPGLEKAKWQKANWKSEPFCFFPAREKANWKLEPGKANPVCLREPAKSFFSSELWPNG